MATINRIHIQRQAVVIPRCGGGIFQNNFVMAGPQFMSVSYITGVRYLPLPFHIWYPSVFTHIVFNITDIMLKPFSKKKLEGISHFCGTTDAPVFDFW